MFRRRLQGIVVPAHHGLDAFRNVPGPDQSFAHHGVVETEGVEFHAEPVPPFAVDATQQGAIGFRKFQGQDAFPNVVHQAGQEHFFV